MVLIGRSRRGIYAILLGDDAPSLHAQLQLAPFVNETAADHTALRREVNRVIAFIDRGAVAGRVDLDIWGRTFLHGMWRALCTIAAGTTCSYRDVVGHLGVPEAIRTVAGACTANVLAIAIPCHRVVRSDGSFSGYRWGVERNRALLFAESAQ